jgi:beta-phosphoglucomutase-like phosphatase (HAD superfamily)
MIGIIFDCDGTLVDSEHTYFASWQAALKPRGGTLTLEEYVTYIGLSGNKVSEILHEKVKADSPEDIYRDAKKAHLETHRSNILPIERTIKFVRHLAERKSNYGIKLGIASAGAQAMIRYSLGLFNLVDCFDVIVSGKDDLAGYTDPEGVNKPKPYIYLHTAKLLDIDPSRCAAFEDSGPGVLAAAGAGLLTFAVPNHFTQTHDFSLADEIIHSSQEIDVESFFQKLQAFIKNPNKKSSL